MSRPPVYLDYHATTPVDRRVLERMLPYFTETFGNPASSTHQWGWKAQEAVEQARREVAALIGASPREIYFTSGATESNNLAIQGVGRAGGPGRRHMVVSAIEHKSVLEAADAWHARLALYRRARRSRAADRSRRAVGGRGADTALVSVMAANNEIGVVQPLAEIGAHRAASRRGVSRGRRAGGRQDPDRRRAMHIDLLALTGHKMYGPKGAGAIFVRKHTRSNR